MDGVGGCCYRKTEHLSRDAVLRARFIGFGGVRMGIVVGLSYLDSKTETQQTGAKSSGYNLAGAPM